MKQFIVLLAVLPLMLVFLAQTSLDQLNGARIALFTDMVYTAKEQAKQEGCFTEEIKESLRNGAAGLFGIDPSEVVIEADSEERARLTAESADFGRGLIHYRVSVPVKEAMAGRRFFGIREEDNLYYYTIDSFTASEKLAGQ